MFMILQNSKVRAGSSVFNHPKHGAGNPEPGIQRDGG